MMAQLIGRREGELFVENHGYFIGDMADDGHMRLGYAEGNGVIGVEPDGADIYTGTAVGSVGLVLELWDAAPELKTDGWDEVVEVSFVATTGHATIRDESEDLSWLDGPNVAFRGPRTYRLRVHVRGRDQSRDSAAFEPEEQHLIQCWPALEAPEIRHKLGDFVGRERRREIPTS